eukprot:5211857-Pyramimonas_sp.AAC.1
MFSTPSPFMRIRTFAATSGSRELRSGQRSEENSCSGSQPEAARAMGGNRGGRTWWRRKDSRWGTATRSAQACRGDYRWRRGCPWLWGIIW